jgi:hypothetical protein
LAIVAAGVILIGVCVFILFSFLLSGLAYAPWLVYKAIKSLRAYVQFYDGIFTRWEEKGGEGPPLAHTATEEPEPNAGTTAVRFSSQSQSKLTASEKEHDERAEVMASPGEVEPIAATTPLESSPGNLKL